MKKKTKEKLDRKLSRLPLVHIDTSIILEKETTDDGYYCKKVLNIIGYKYRGKFSMPMLSEILLRIIRLDDAIERHKTLDMICMLIKEKNIDLHSVKNIENNVNKIKELDPSISPNDRLIVACAIIDNATLVTLDKRLIKNKTIEERFGIKIRHPKDLV